MRMPSVNHSHKTAKERDRFTELQKSHNLLEPQCVYIIIVAVFIVNNVSMRVRIWGGHQKQTKLLNSSGRQSLKFANVLKQQLTQIIANYSKAKL